MESYTVVRPEHLNQYGHLFGGCLLKWVDEIAWIAASRDNPGCRFVTIGMDRVAFHRGVHQGAVLRFDASEQSRGCTSITYVIRVFADDLNTGAEEAIFSTCITFVRLDETGCKIPLPNATIV
ncbi:acyl-CoA thioesterase [Chromatium okenii]|jgi:acyl-CoA hydrolase|uniref:Acyl-CoA thioesterase n=1 Tax=Chromatium okenii TaxID=61644 RepID=A0A2S7XRF7_9GAMM|nr:acyl-CoA thioesterase [Chromatium okenii]MBV5310288.1 acyl-CoA thioesterase [Chromatium okenii]PQJ96319.1 acyl-CoA thioesterase [Chromatium okenii]